MCRNATPTRPSLMAAPPGLDLALPSPHYAGGAAKVLTPAREGGAVDEAAWLTCTDPRRLLGELRGRLDDRKVRLFGCAGLRSVWHLLTYPRCREAVEVAE